MNKTTGSVDTKSRLGFTPKELQRVNTRRYWIDSLTRIGIKIGGSSVIFAVCLIFFYLLYEVIPLIKGASVDVKQQYSLLQAPDTKYLYSIEEQNKVGMRLSKSGSMEFFDLKTGDILLRQQLSVEGRQVTTVSNNSPASRLIAVGMDDGTVVLVKHEYTESFHEGEKKVTPSLVYPYGTDPIEVLPTGQAIQSLAVRATNSDVLIVAQSKDFEFYSNRFRKVENFLNDSFSLVASGIEKLPNPRRPVNRMLIEHDTRFLYFIQERSIEVYDLKSTDDIRSEFIKYSKVITSAEFLLGEISLLIGDSDGNISQMFSVRNKDERYELKHVREFTLSDKPIVFIEPEQRRKGFVAVDSSGMVGIFHSTAEVAVFTERLTDTSVTGVAMGPRADSLLLVDTNGKTTLFDVSNDYPEVSFSVLWQQVWYENYDEPDYIWQSSAANNEFEPKYSLVPLAFGTLKAAFYAMILAMPLAICGAIFTAQFMAPRIRTKVKPAIELMEALPTVILGFLAGLWLAPFVENNLPGIFALLVITPLFILIFGFAWQQLPLKIRLYVPDGWQPILLVPVVVLAAIISIGSSDQMQAWLFGGDMRAWLINDIGISFDQRNALIVGLAMGFAVIPNIFSIAEDALFAVPKSLTQGSLALGATQWQTLVRVVLPTASPGIFSAVMIGFGRAVGETMIVLMATGNTPIMDMNIFEGLRTLSANIAVEMPEAEVGSSHYRILFLTALVLFIFTFIFNSSAEIIRQRLREKYGSL